MKLSANVFFNLVGPEEILRPDSSIMVSSFDASAYGGGPLLHQQQIEFEVLDVDSIQSEQISMLNSRKLRVMAEAQHKVDEIEGQIQSLLAISHKE